MIQSSDNLAKILHEKSKVIDLLAHFYLEFEKKHTQKQLVQFQPSIRCLSVSETFIWMIREYLVVRKVVT